jgi:LacI family transcriptional regulator
MKGKVSRRQRNAPTVKDVAKHAGVSPMTVSRVINQQSKVGAATRDRVNASIAALNYAPSTLARSLAAGDDIRIALLYAFPPSSYLSEFLIGSLMQASRTHIHLSIDTFDFTVPLGQVVANLQQSRIDGVILMSPLCDNGEILAAMKEAELPLLAIATGREPRDISTVSIDDQFAAYEMTRHLIALGHNRIAFIKGNPSHGSAHRRLTGHIEALSDAGIEQDPALIVQGQFTYRSGLDAAEQLMALAQPPSAIFACNDDMAAAAVAVAHQHGLDVPGDLSVCGFDDAPLATTIWPELTTIRQPIEEMSRAAVEVLAREIRSTRDREAITPLRVLLDFSLVRRQSDAAPRWQRRNG